MRHVFAMMLPGAVVGIFAPRLGWFCLAVIVSLEITYGAS